ncbi:MAG: LPS export ABC transporter periplasmic protein LptC [Oceanospirillaceae bacterium]
MLVARHKLRLIFAILIVIFAVIGWINFDNQNKTIIPTTTSNDQDVDFYIKKAHFKAFNSNGQLANTATSDYIEHYKQRQISQLSAPYFVNYKDLDISQTIKSQTATALDTSGKITFKKQVLAISFKNALEDTYLKTETLHYDRNKNSVSTDDFIEFTDTFGNITTSTGLFSDMNSQTVNFKTNVKGTFNEK